MTHFLIVLATSHHAISAQARLKIPAITTAHTSVIALDQTAGQTLFATSFAPIFNAI